MVRNNHHANARSALGFLSDARRMNVLLSRARWQLILVGSLDFLEVVVEAAQQSRNTDGIEAVAELTKYLRAGVAAGTIALVSPGTGTGGKR